MKCLLAFSLFLAVTACWMSAGTDAAVRLQLPEPTPTPQSNDKGKKNSRPESRNNARDDRSPRADQLPGAPIYFYEFVRPGFSYGQVSIQHDENGQGKISFLKDGFDETITDPIALSPATVAKIKQLLTDLDFLNSNEEYQHERDFSNLGNVTFTVRKDGRERTVKYNWTANKNAKELMDEYRRIANEYTWLFEINVARVNQPLRTPAMMDALDGYLRRKEISDPTHLLPHLTALSTDEKIPLISRNHALKLIKQIEKTSK